MPGSAGGGGGRGPGRGRSLGRGGCLGGRRLGRRHVRSRRTARPSSRSRPCGRRGADRRRPTARGSSRSRRWRRSRSRPENFTPWRRWNVHSRQVVVGLPALGERRLGRRSRPSCTGAAVRRSARRRAAPRRRSRRRSTGRPARRSARTPSWSRSPACITERRSLVSGLAWAPDDVGAVAHRRPAVGDRHHRDVLLDAGRWPGRRGRRGRLGSTVWPAWRSTSTRSGNGVPSP